MQLMSQYYFSNSRSPCKLFIVKYDPIKTWEPGHSFASPKSPTKQQINVIFSNMYYMMKQIVIHLLDLPDGIPRLCKMQSLAPNQRRLSFVHLCLVLQPFCEQHQVAYHCYKRLQIDIGISKGRKEHADPPTGNNLVYIIIIFELNLFLKGWNTNKKHNNDKIRTSSKISSYEMIEGSNSTKNASVASIMF